MAARRPKVLVAAKVVFVTALASHLCGVLFNEVLLATGFYLEFAALLLYLAAGSKPERQ